jgi:hypothetical protein
MIKKNSKNIPHVINPLINKLDNKLIDESKLIEKIITLQSLPVDVVKNFRKSRGTIPDLKVNY